MARDRWKPIERELRKTIGPMIAGVDEVGRGPLAGPVVACAIIMPPDERVIRGVVLLPDGRPVEGARVTLQDPRWPMPVPGADAMSGKDGRFTLRCLDGTRYIVLGMTYGSGAMLTEPASVEAGADAVELRLVLTRRR